MFLQKHVPHFPARIHCNLRWCKRNFKNYKDFGNQHLLCWLYLNVNQAQSTKNTSFLYFTLSSTKPVTRYFFSASLYFVRFHNTVHGGHFCRAFGAMFSMTHTYFAQLDLLQTSTLYLTNTLSTRTNNLRSSGRITQQRTQTLRNWTRISHCPERWLKMCYVFSFHLRTI